MISIREATRRTLWVACAATALVPASARAQASQQPPAEQPPARRGFELFALVDYAATGVRASGNYRFWVSNSGPMDVQAGTLAPPNTPMRVNRGGFFSQFNEVTLWAAAAPGDLAANRSRVASLSNVTGLGAAVSFNYHRDLPGVSHWRAVDGALGFKHSGRRSTADATCLNHTASPSNLVPGVPLMAGSDCPETWGLDGFEGRRPVPVTSYQAIFNADRDGFRFDFFEVPLALQDTTSFLGDRFQTFGIANDYSRERKLVFGSVIPGATGAPAEEGYPLGLEWKFDAFTVAAAPGVVFWQATVTNKTAELYGVGLDYDSLYAGVLARHGRPAARVRAGFDVARGTAVFNEIGHNGTCDGALPVPGNFASDAFFGTCASGPVGFGQGTSAIVFLKSPIGDLRYKQFSDPTSFFHHPASPVAGDTITFNIGRLCGDDCIGARFVPTPNRGFGVLAAREALALGGDAPNSLDAFTYYSLFHPANNAASPGGGSRVDLSNPRAGGGYNYTVPATASGNPWRYATRPAGAPAGSDTLFLDTCNPTTNTCNPIWHDTLPGGVLIFSNKATWVGAGPFRLAAGESKALVLALIGEPDSTSMERSINTAISLYQGFFVAPKPPPPPRVVAVNVTGGSTRFTFVRILLDNRAIGYVDPFIQQMANRYRTAAPTSVEGRLQRLNRLGTAQRTIADTLDILARNSVAGVYVYKSCDLGRTYTTSASPNLCSRDVVRDSLGREIGPAAYRFLSGIDTLSTFTDGTVLAGQTYRYVFVAASRGVRLQLFDSTAAGRRSFDTTLVAPTSAFPTVANAPNVADVYVPASAQAGGEPARVRYTGEAGAVTFEGDSAAWNTPTVIPRDTIADTLRYRLVFGDSVIVREYLTAAAIDSTRVVVFRSQVTGYTFSGAGVNGRLATPVRAPLDSLVFTRRGAVKVPLVTTAPIASTDTPLGGARVVRNYVLKGAGGFLSGTTLTTNTALIVGPAPQGVLALERDGELIPVVVGNDFRTGAFANNARIFSSPDFEGVVVDVINRPVLTASGAQRASTTTIWLDLEGLAIGGGLSDRPTLDWQPVISRLLGTSTGEYAFTFGGSEWGPGAPFTLGEGGLAGLQEQITSSLQQRVVEDMTVNDARTVAAINASLGTSLTADSLLVVKLPFTAVNRSYGDRPVRFAIRAADKMYDETDLVRTDANRYYKMGTGIDTARVFIPKDIWVPGEQLIMLEEIELPGGDSLVVTASRAQLGCAAAIPAFCNVLTGPGGVGYITADAGQTLVVRYAVPFTSDRDFAFTVLPVMAGERIATVTRTQLDSVRVVPNPYILYSNYEQSATNEQRIMFTHLPPSGVIRIYTVTGQFVQQISWTPADLRGNGDLYFNLLTREGTLMASGLYLYTVRATGDAGSARRDKIGRFIIIR